MQTNTACLVNFLENSRLVLKFEMNLKKKPKKEREYGSIMGYKNQDLPLNIFGKIYLVQGSAQTLSIMDMYK